MPKYIAMIIVDVENNFKNRRPEARMIEKFIENRIAIGEVEEKLYRQQVTMKIKGVKISVLAE